MVVLARSKGFRGLATPLEVSMTAISPESCCIGAALLNVAGESKCALARTTILRKCRKAISWALVI